MARRGNPNLKKAHEGVEITYEQVLEFKKCISDPVYFIKNYVYVTHAMHGKIKFKLYDYQEDLIRNYHQNRYNIVLSARQTGKTETSCAFLLWYAIFNDAKTVLVVSKDSESAMEIIKRIQDAYEELPHWLKPGIEDDNWNKHTAGFDNKSRIIARSTTESSGRGLSISLLYCDEIAFVKNSIQNSFWTSILPTLSTGGACIMTSTPNGDVDLFSTLWRGAEAETNQFVPFRVDWDQPPGRDEKFKEEQIGLIGENRWRQEYLCEFISSDNSLFDTRLVQIQQKKFQMDEYVFELNGEQGFYKPISQDMSYVVGIDPSTGNGNDYSVIEVFEFPSMQQVMEFRSNTVSEVVLYSHLKKVLCFLEKYAGDIYFSVEANGVGRALIALYMQDENPPMFSHFMSEMGKNKLGYTTTNKSKKDCAFRFKNMFERGEMMLHSKVMYTEMKSYVRKGETFEAQTGATDDCISAVYIIMRMLDEIAVYDPRAYEKLYRFSDQASGDEWYTDGESDPRGDSYGDIPLPAGIF